MLTAPPVAPPASAVAWSFEVAVRLTVPLPMLAEPMPASVVAPEVTFASPFAPAPEINPIEKILASTMAVFAAPARIKMPTTTTKP